MKIKSKNLKRQNSEAPKKKKTDSKKSLSIRKQLFLICFGIFSFISLFLTLSIGYSVHQGLRKISEYQNLEASKVLDRHGNVIGLFLKEKRFWVPYNQIPKNLIDALIATEDKSFFNNSGVDFLRILYAAADSVRVIVSGSGRISGASTITQQVVKNIALTRHRTITRKVSEIILAVVMTTKFSKEEIMELYVNHIFLGENSYGFAAAADTYFGKKLEDLTLGEIALLAGLPKSPSYLNPVNHKDRAIARRSIVLNRMLMEKFISEDEYNDAINNDIVIKKTYINFDGGSFLDYVKHELINSGMSEEDIYSKGYSIQTTLDQKLHYHARNALRYGLELHDKKMGYRGPVSRIDLNSILVDETNKQLAENKSENVQQKDILDRDKEYNNLKDCIVSLNKCEIDDKIYIKLKDNFVHVSDISFAKELRAALVLSVSSKNVLIAHCNNKGLCLKEYMPHEIFSWALKSVNEGSEKVYQGVKSNFLEGDVIFLNTNKKEGEYKFVLWQRPEIQGSILVVNIPDGKIRAMVGGYEDRFGLFNRAFMAKRQVGSIIKPFVYMSALESGINPTDIFIDAPLDFDLGDGVVWSPKNAGMVYRGPVTVRLGFQKSLNTVTIRLASAIGIRRVKNMFTRFGLLDSSVQVNMSMVLGSFEVDQLSMMQSFATIGNYGKSVYLNGVLKVEDRQKNTTPLIKNNINDKDIMMFDSNNEPLPPGYVVNPEYAYQILSFMEGAVKNGTSRRLAQKTDASHFGCKTGTSQEGRDLWMVCLSGSIGVIVFAGYDTPRDTKEYGATIALPILAEFLSNARSEMKIKQFVPIETLKSFRVNIYSGKRTLDPKNMGHVVDEYFSHLNTIPELEEGDEEDRMYY